MHHSDEAAPLPPVPWVLRRSASPCNPQFTALAMLLHTFRVTGGSNAGVEAGSLALLALLAASIPLLLPLDGKYIEGVVSPELQSVSVLLLERSSCDPCQHVDHQTAGHDPGQLASICKSYA